MKKYILAGVCVLVFMCSAAYCQSGTLFIIGGGEIPQYMLERFISLAGGPQTPILILPMASEEPLDRALDFKDRLEKMGAKNVDYIVCSSKTADSQENLEKMRAARAVYMTGGDQNLLTGALAGTQLFTGLHRVYEHGGVIGGTSAGAAIMSKVMITGNDLSVSSATEDSDSFAAVKPGMVEISEGLGFIDTAIVDQHFLKRKRYGRLFSAVLAQPELYGIGIDEATAAIIRPDGIVEAFGESSVMIIDARGAQVKTSKSSVFSAQDIQVHFLAGGDTFSPAARKAGTVR